MEIKRPARHKRKNSCREDEAEERERGEREEARNGKDVQKQDSAGKVVEARSQRGCECLLRPFPTWSLANTQCQSTPAHPLRCRASGPGGWGRGADLSWEAEEEVEEVGGWGVSGVP